MAAGANAVRVQFLQCGDGAGDALAIARRSGWERRTLGALLAEREIVSQHQETGLGEGTRQQDQQRSVAV
jgi:hypothetical protein